MRRKNKPGKKRLIDDLIPLVKMIQRLREQGRTLGMFTDDRELLECSKCGLVEDVAAYDLLIIYLKSSKEPKDCGLRFEPIDSHETIFECPSCGTRIKAVIL